MQITDEMEQAALMAFYSNDWTRGVGSAAMRRALTAAFAAAPTLSPPPAGATTEVRPQTAEFQADGPVDGMNEKHPEGSYVRVHIEAKDGTRHCYLVSHGGAEVLEIGLRASRPTRATAPPTTVPVRVAVAFDVEGRPAAVVIERGQNAEAAWNDLDRDWQAPLRSCIATIPAPVPVVPEVGAQVQPAGEG